MNGPLWAYRPQPAEGSGVLTVGRWRLRSPADVTASRGWLRDAVLDGRATADSDRDDVERLLLAFEELASNGLRHGRPPVQVSVTASAGGWLIDVTDSAVDAPPTPAVGRDAAQGGLGLYLVARLCSAHGWAVHEGRKHVWACVERTARTATDRDACHR